ncbi:MAG: hypothetical protein KBS42_04765 [Bacteroidales bacterium]|nr:hypothetical protein [Candidatus Colicola coprequi]
MRKSTLFLCLFLILAIGLSSCSQTTNPQPKYIVQVSMGTFSQQYYSADEVIARLEEVTKIIPLEKVLIGWSLDQNTYRRVGEYLRSKGIQMILYLPIFAETEEITSARKAVDLWGNTPALYGKGGFCFTCPTDTINYLDLISVYEQYFSDIPFDGVFLDRIRTQSFVGGVSGVLSCGCEQCKARYNALGVDLDSVKLRYEQKGDHFFNVTNYTPKSGFIFEDKLAADFLEAKGCIIADEIKKISNYFHDRNMIVGLDLYAPLLAQFVGQDYERLAQICDFIKPMLYRCTYAPAGISYEYDLLRQNLPNATGYPDFHWDVNFLKGQLEAFGDLPCAKYPGIEIVYNEDIAPTTDEYILESLRAVRDFGYDGTVLSWSIMWVPNEHIQLLKKL